MALLAVMMFNSSAWAAGRLFFTTIVERNDIGDPQVVAEWGALDGELPAEIRSFKLYRSENGGSFDLVAELPFVLASASDLEEIASTDTSGRFGALLADLAKISADMEPPGPEIDDTNFADFLYNLLSPSGTYFDPLRAMLLTRAHLAAARGQGLAFIDDKVIPGVTYNYMLTAVTDGGESLPVGQSGKVDVSNITELPAPTGLRQVRLSACSSLRGGMDDNLIHMVWDLPVRPEEIGLRALIYGYDIYWTDTDRGTVDFRSGVPAGFHKVNPAPILASGPPPATGPDSFLAVDSAENHTEGPEWKPGQEYYYYLVSRDIAGHYCGPVAAARLHVVDATPPHPVWDAHSMEIADTDSTTGETTSRLAIVWDQHNSTNFVRSFGSTRSICSASEKEVCYVNSDATCDSAPPRCADLDVENYLVFRFDSPQAASQWGTDSDGDHWPDDMEEATGTDPCDAANRPAGEPAELAAVISPDDASYYRDISPTHRQMVFVDTAVAPDNHVYWYRIIAVDSQGNQSPLSPPIRGVLYDRTQPVPKAELKYPVCSYSAELHRDCGESPDDETLLVLKDETGDVASFSFFQVCTLNDIQRWRKLADGVMDKGAGFITYRMLEQYECSAPECGYKFQSDFVVRFYDSNGKILTETVPFSLEYLCYFAGCIIVEKVCEEATVRTPNLIPRLPLKVCVDLEKGESARVYYQTQSGMSPFLTFDAATSSDEYCKTFDKIEGIVPADLCIGVRVFSENHVGSVMMFLGCVELHAESGKPLPPPVLSPVETVAEGGQHYLRLRWSEPAAGIGSFIVEISDEDHKEYESLWGLNQDDADRFEYLDQILASEMGKEFCYRVRALSTDLKTTEWSNPQCGKWEQGDHAYLPWPPVAEPEKPAKQLGAFYLDSYQEERPVLVLSPDIETSFEVNERCRYRICDIPDSQSKMSCLDDEPLEFYYCPACSYVRSQIIADSFIVYRQEEGHDFVQVSPLIDSIYCSVEDHGEIIDILHDPFIFLLEVNPDTVKGVDDTSLGAGVRILFKDRHPFRGNTRIRYKLLQMDRETGEPVKEYTSNWVDIP